MTRRLLVLMLVLLPLLAVPTAASAVGAPERKVLDLVDASRQHHHLHAVVERAKLMRHAERHTRVMARKRLLFHSSLSIDGYSALGECVGVGGTVHSVYKAFLRSSTHRRIILGRWKYIGVGVVSRGGDRYVTIDFAR